MTWTNTCPSPSRFGFRLKVLIQLRHLKDVQPECAHEESSRACGIYGQGIKLVGKRARGARVYQPGSCPLKIGTSFVDLTSNTTRQWVAYLRPNIVTDRSMTLGFKVSFSLETVNNVLNFVKDRHLNRQKSDACN